MPGWPTKSKIEQIAPTPFAPVKTEQTALPAIAGNGLVNETIMLYGKSKVGKTFAACSVIDHVLKQDPSTMIFYVCTDNQLIQTFNQYFGERSDEVRKHLTIYNVYEFKMTTTPLFSQISQMFHDIRKLSGRNKKNWLIVDLADKFWRWAQAEWIDQSAPQNTATTYMSDAAKDLKKFMEFSHSQWQFIQRLDNMATFDVVENPPCNLLYIFGEKEMEVIEDKPAEGAAREVADIFALVGCKPEGQKKLPYAFSTIVYLLGTKDKKFFVLGDRGYPLEYTEKSYGRNWYASFLADRKKER